VSPTAPAPPAGSLQTEPVTGAGSLTTLTASTTHTQTRAPISFTLSGCPSLPPGDTVSGSGEDLLVLNSRVGSDGVTHIERNDLVTGQATDSAGATYTFNYHNHANIDVEAGGFPTTITTTDHFNLVGNGQAAQLHVGFVARVTITSPTEPPSFTFVNAHGNPFFCDPI
jgi:hypothetical protein